MPTTKMPQAEIERLVDAIAAGQRMAGEEPTLDDLDAVRRVLAGKASAQQEIDEGLAIIGAAHHTVR